MRWDAVILNIDKNIKSIKDIPKGWMPVSLGTIDEIKQKINETIPSIIWKENTWGQFRGDGFCLEANLHEKDGVTSLSFNIYGG